MDELINQLFGDRIVVTVKEIQHWLRISPLTVRRRLKQLGIRPLGGGPRGYRLTRAQVELMFPTQHESTTTN